MDIHKPKAAHSWREFLIEIGTIICGILIAVGLEQMVEAVHRDAEVREAREALHEELGGMLQALQYALEEDRCVLKQLDSYDAWATGGAKPAKFRMFSPLNRSSVWETVKSGAVPHMPIKERVKLTFLFDLMEDYGKNRSMQLAQWDQLDRAWSHHTLEPSEARRLHEEVGVFRTDTRAHAGENQQLEEAIAVVGVKPEPMNTYWRGKLDWVCGRTSADPFAVIDGK